MDIKTEQQWRKRKKGTDDEMCWELCARPTTLMETCAPGAQSDRDRDREEGLTS